MQKHSNVLVVAMCAFFWPAVSRGQSVPPAEPTDRPTIRAMRLGDQDRVTVDGRLDEPSWERAEPANVFIQSEPRNGEPGTERTDIRVMFNRDNLYIGAQFFDSDPGGMLGNQMVRDGGLGSDDRFMWVLDPFNDLRSGYFFETNPAGGMSDAQLVPASSA